MLVCGFYISCEDFKNESFDWIIDAWLSGNAGNGGTELSFAVLSGDCGFEDGADDCVEG